MKLLEQVFQQRAMQVVQICPGHLPVAYLLHGRRVPSPPSIGKATPIDVDAFGLLPCRAFFDNRSAPVHHGAKSVKDKCLHCRRQSCRILAACAASHRGSGDARAFHNLSPRHIQYPGNILYLSPKQCPGRARKIKTMLQWPDVLNLAKSGNPAPDRKVVKTDAEWREQLSDEEYHVTRQAGTERAFSSQMCSLFEPGIYSCLCCDTLLFDASEKFESHTGWPSFTQPIKDNVIAYRFDGPAFLKRGETICNICDAPLGHVFPDGPPPSGLRYCMNAVALQKAAKV